MHIPFLGTIVKTTFKSSVQMVNYFTSKRIFEAIEKDNIQIIRDYINQNGNLDIVWNEDFTCNALNVGTDTLLNYAIYKDRFEIFKLLVDSGADINSKHNFETPLGYTVSLDRRPYFEYLVSKHAILDERGRETGLGNGCTPLIEAVCKNRFDYVKRLIELGANPVRTNRDRVIPIYYTREKDISPDIFKYLLDHMSDYQINMHFQNRVFTVLILITFYGAHNHRYVIEMLDYLLKRNVELDKLNRHGASALYCAEETLYSSNNRGKNEFYIAQEKIVERLKAVGAKSYFKGKLRNVKPFYLYKTDSFA